MQRLVKFYLTVGNEILKTKNQSRFIYHANKLKLMIIVIIIFVRK